MIHRIRNIRFIAQCHTLRPPISNSYLTQDCCRFRVIPDKFYLIWISVPFQHYGTQQPLDISCKSVRFLVKHVCCCIQVGNSRRKIRSMLNMRYVPYTLNPMCRRCLRTRPEGFYVRSVT